MKPSRDTEKVAAHHAAATGRIDIMKYFVEERKRSDDLKFNYLVASAAMHGKLDCLKYLVEEAKVPLTRGISSLSLGITSATSA